MQIQIKVKNLTNPFLGAGVEVSGTDLATYFQYAFLELKLPVNWDLQARSTHQAALNPKP